MIGANYLWGIGSLFIILNSCAEAPKEGSTNGLSLEYPSIPVKITVSIPRLKT